MNLDINLSTIFTYFLFLFILGTIIWSILYIIRKKVKIEDIKINPLAPIFGLLFIISIWLADLTTLELGNYGMKTLVGISPVSSSKVPALFVWIVVLIAMFFINYFFNKLNVRKKNKKLYSFNKMLVYTQLMGLISFLFSAIAIIGFGYGETFFGFYLLNIYHSTLPLIIITTFILSVDIK